MGLRFHNFEPITKHFGTRTEEQERRRREREEKRRENVKRTCFFSGRRRVFLRGTNFSGRVSDY